MKKIVISLLAVILISSCGKSTRVADTAGSLKN
jgi:hypothetical protein